MMFRKFLLPGRYNSPNHFKLLQNFSIISLSGFVLTASLLSFFYRQQAVRELVRSTEENNVALTKVFASTFRQKYLFLLSLQDHSHGRLATDPRIHQLQDEISVQFEDSLIVKIKIFDLQGHTVFSTDLSQIGGASSSSESGYLLARSGQIVSQLEHRDTFKALKITLRDRHLLSSYIPIRANNSSREIIGVFELYTDVTPLLQRIEQTQRSVALGSMLILAMLYSILFLFVCRADGLLKKQYQQLQESEDRYRHQASELKHLLAELQQTQAQMVQSEKLSSLGQMVAGVAHEINNPISFIHGNLKYVQEYSENLLRLVQLYQSHYPDPASDIQTEAQEIDLTFIQNDLPKILSSMRVGSTRIREIVLALRIFSRLDEAKIKSVDLHEGLDSTLMILQHRLKACPERPEIRVIKTYSTLPPVECYAGLINQVFMNILVNAIEALEEQTQTLTHQQCLDNPSQIALQTSLINNQWVQIAIADNGPGIALKTQQKIFDPFFTTKRIGRGTGMGLSISYQIVTERHGGTLKCFSTPGKGTEFVIQIPVRQTASMPAC
ncbi:MAG: hypothetical protein HC881_17005 [Leptolyngbyaceae cyanobacterium SL_7_1]|nr:hypothetical protein [Leptolyngbyaceae cyanobacterium SL_7_1]